MNNDISKDTNYYINIQKTNNSSTNSSEVISSRTISDEILNTTADSMGCLGAMGCAQVNMDNPFSKRCLNSVEEFLQNPELAEAKIELCDELVKKGYKLEEAIIKTDLVFDTLKQANLYN